MLQVNGFLSGIVEISEIPQRLYALRLDEEGPDKIVFDAIDARVFDMLVSTTSGSRLNAAFYNQIDQAKIYAVEVASRDLPPDFFTPSRYFRRRWLPRWVEISLEGRTDFPAAIYRSMTGEPAEKRVRIRPLDKNRRRALVQATSLSQFVAPDAEVTALFPSTLIDGVVVLDVGQGSAAALRDTGGQTVAYVDLGSGVLGDAKTWPASMADFCFAARPLIILSHWHYDHFHGANRTPSAAIARSLNWVAPLQTLGPGPQSAMASALAKSGNLKIWAGNGSLRRGAIELERASGPHQNLNRTGLAVWVDGPNGEDPILLPGDAGYGDIFSLARGRSITSFTAAHHGGWAPGTPPNRPGAVNTAVAMSYGHSNGYRHPLPASLNSLQAQGWALGHPGSPADERHTVERRPAAGGIHTVGGAGLGHIHLKWPNSAPAPSSCFCGCSVKPTQ